MSQLQIGLIIAGILLVIGVIAYNSWQERRMRRKLGAVTSAPADEPAPAAARVEPTLRTLDDDGDVLPAARDVTASAAVPGAEVAHDADWRAPVEDVTPASALVERSGPVESLTEPGVRPGPRPEPMHAAPDPDIECIAMLTPAKSTHASAVAAGLHARLGKAVRWYGRRDENGPWQRISTETRGDYRQFAACMLLADRNGPATRAQIEAFARMVAEIAPTIPAAYEVPDAAAEAERAVALDRLCAELDMQIGLTIQKAQPAAITGTRLRGVAEAAGFRLAPTGRFEYVQEETGAVLFTLQNVTDEPFTADTLRSGTTSGVVFLLDVPRVAEPARAFDQMKIAAKRMATTLGGEVVDDNRRLLNDSGMAAIRTQVAEAAEALKRCHIDPGSPRALKLFAA